MTYYVLSGTLNLTKPKPKPGTQRKWFKFSMWSCQTCSSQMENFAYLCASVWIGKCWWLEIWV